MIELWKCQGKKTRITLKNGHVYVGIPYQYTSGLDNEPDGACIYMDDTEILESEISGVELINE